jgi:polysaccharide export outer membrane protein
MTAYVAGERDGTFGRLIFDLKGPAQYWIRGETGVLILGIMPREANGGNEESDDGGETEGAPSAEIPDPVESTESAHPSKYEIEPEGVNPEVFFGRKPLDFEHYRIGPEDVLEIRVFELEQLNRTVRVLADGNIDLPLIGLVPVGGLTSTEAAEQVAGRLQNRFVQNPQVSVLITEFNSRKVSLLGAVARPATYPLVGRRNLLQIIADAGGLSGEAGGLLYVFRPLPDGKSARLSVPLSELLIKGDPRWNIWLLSGDIVSIPPEEAITVSVLGAVRNPGLYKLPVGEDASLLRAIALAGGLTERGSKSGIQVKRRTGSGKETVIKVDLGKILSGDKPDVFLEEGDVILVKESFF